ncbi:MAG: vsr [Myxococcales bacterium]|nr:vsr [Myxococcales bacterium]
MATLTASYVGLRPKSKSAARAARGSSKKRDTRCELVLRKALTAAGLRYRVDTDDLPGRPDVVFRGARVAVFCDGDFWHGRNLAARVAKLAEGHNAPYWVAKITTNTERDARNTRALEEQGWMVLRYWETDIHKDAAGIAADVVVHVHERRPLRR